MRSLVFLSALAFVLLAASEQGPPPEKPAGVALPYFRCFEDHFYEVDRVVVEPNPVVQAQLQDVEDEARRAQIKLEKVKLELLRGRRPSP